jgi:hypothetical protein
VRTFLKSKSFFDEFYFSNENLYDVVAVHLLAKKAKELNASYVCHLEDDFYFYENDFLDSCFEFLDKNEDCGYLRILKYEYDNKSKYSKFTQTENKDKANCQRHFNCISNKKLAWEEVGKIGIHHFYKNNWHWYNFANIARTDVFENIIPKSDCKPLQKLEKVMMQKYNDLNLKVGVLDLGAVTHLGHFTEKTSHRIRLFKEKLPVIKYEEVLEEIESCDLYKPGY